MKDIIKKHSLESDDILRRTDLTREQGLINSAELRTALMKLDPSLNKA